MRISLRTSVLKPSDFSLWTPIFLVVLHRRLCVLALGARGYACGAFRSQPFLPCGLGLLCLGFRQGCRSGFPSAYKTGASATFFLSSHIASPLFSPRHRFLASALSSNPASQRGDLGITDPREPSYYPAGPPRMMESPPAPACAPPPKIRCSPPRRCCRLQHVARDVITLPGLG